MAYGDWLPKITPTNDSYEEGDVIAYVNKEGIVGYRKANESDDYIIGVVNSAAVAVTSSTPDAYYYDNDGNEIEFATDEERLEYGHIPVALNGIVDVKFQGESEIGGYIVMSDTQGVARLRTDDDELISFGKILKDPIDTEEVRLIQILLLDNEIMRGMSVMRESNTEMMDAMNALLMGEEELPSEE